MTDINNVQVDVVYHEGGDCYRPFTVIKVPSQYNWLTPNISFFQSSGRSNNNENQNDLRRNAWFPTIGLLIQDSALYKYLREIDLDNSQMYTNGYIIKLNALTKILGVSHTSWKWISAYQINLSWLNNKATASYSLFNELSKTLSQNEIADLGFFLFDYFKFWWQIQISAQLNGGIWEKYPALRFIALNYDITEYAVSPEFKKRVAPLEDIHVNFSAHNKDNKAPPNMVEVNKYLIDNQAFYDFSNIPLPAKKIGQNLLKNIPQVKVNVGGKMKMNTRRKKSIAGRKKNTSYRKKNTSYRKKSNRRKK